MVGTLERSSYQNHAYVAGSAGPGAASAQSLSGISAAPAAAPGQAPAEGSAREPSSHSPVDSPETARGAGAAPAGKKECKTCKSRRYRDGSNEANVSFKSATHVSPEAAAGQVLAHEYQHVKNGINDALQNDKKILSQTVQLKTACCPECGKFYVSGGLTTTVTAQKSDDGYAQMMGKGRNVDMRA